GDLLRFWRQQRRMSQLDLACEAEISTRHLSFIETGRSVPSREMVLHLAEFLEIPLRERNLMLTAAGYAPFYTEKSLDDRELEAARKTVELILTGHEPFPAMAIDRHWTLVKANRAVKPLMAGVAPFLLEAPVNVLRLTLHPEGLANRIVNYAEWRSHLLERLHRQIEVSADAVLMKLLEEFSGYPAPDGQTRAPVKSLSSAMAVFFRLRMGEQTLSFISTTTVFGTPVEITLSELAIESFFPADRETAESLALTSSPVH
ncbi:MAG TPA: helix-turn-helix transcriptional regulator, partial [Pyrinomonadaceae bacterium]|nr:helix-turn-helix transcriptional regulator [Pyrinomonadaceae bacterium]